MTPREKAKELYEKFQVQEFNEVRGWHTNHAESKENAINVVNEVLSVVFFHKNTYEHWRKVKAEIESL